MKQVEVQIMGTGYVLGIPEGGEARLQLAVRKVDAAMCRIRDAGKIRARDRIAVLAALNLAFELADRDRAALPKAAIGRVATVALPPAAAGDAAAARLAALSQRLDAALGDSGEDPAELVPLP